MADTSWRNRKTLILSRSEMIGLLEPEEYVRCVETAFRRMGEGRIYMEPKGHIVLDEYPGEWEIMPSYIEEPEAAPAAAACKWVSIRFENRAKFNLPTVFSILIYTEPEDRLSARHRGRHPSHPDADRRVRRGLRQVDGTRGLLGSGAGRGRRREHRRLPHLRSNARLEGSPGLEPDPGDAGCVHGGRAASTHRTWSSSPPPFSKTWCREPMCSSPGRRARRRSSGNELIEDGMHIAALGGGLAGTQELDVAILHRSRIIVDDMRQCITDGEINVPLTRGEIEKSDVAGDIGEVITGKIPGRTSASEVTLFDSTGIALQDSATLPLRIRARYRGLAWASRRR